LVDLGFSGILVYLDNKLKHQALPMFFKYSLILDKQKLCVLTVYLANGRIEQNPDPVTTTLVTTKQFSIFFLSFFSLIFILFTLWTFQRLRIFNNWVELGFVFKSYKLIWLIWLYPYLFFVQTIYFSFFAPKVKLKGYIGLGIYNLDLILTFLVGNIAIGLI